ncbi:hypothetical protein RJT34_08036 [Clitoria ternatea]|uniref:Uncharacterized protein n=1 Tax=Clitoria ternatea TaxID=43366 RepID=A0AAN9K611_CLITE
MKNLGLRFVMDQYYYFKKKHGKDIRKDNRVIDKLRRECELAKRALNTQHQVRVEIESLFDDSNSDSALRGSDVERHFRNKPFSSRKQEGSCKLKEGKEKE